MPSTNTVPTFNMKVVVQETGLKPDTLRAWERRYGVPNPQRSPGGHRLYSQFEIDLLKWLVARQEEGMSISHAVDLWQQLKHEGANPLLTMETAVSDTTLVSSKGERVDDLRREWLEASLSFDEYKAKYVLARAFAVLPMETVCHKILQQGLHEIGQGWYEGEISVQQEHFTSGLALRQLEALLTALPAPIHSERILVACPSTELHTFSSLMISLLLRRKGWDVVYLGADVPLERMEAAIEQIKPALVIMSSQTLTSAGHLLRMAQKVQELGVLFAFGGAVFNNVPEMVHSIPGHFLGKSLEEVPLKIEKLLKTSPVPSQVKTRSKAYQAAYEHFLEQRPAIEANLQRLPQVNRMPITVLQNINKEFGDDIEAALHLGELEMVNENLRWVKGLLGNHSDIPNMPLEAYLQAYHRALGSVMDERATPLLNWLAEIDLSS